MDFYESDPYSDYYYYDPKPEDFMDETMKEVYYAYCAVEFDASRIWVDKDDDYIGLSLLQRYRKFVIDVIDPEWENIVRNILDEETIKQLFNAKPMYFHRIPKFEDEKKVSSSESDSDSDFEDESDEEYFKDFEI